MRLLSLQATALFLLSAVGFVPASAKPHRIAIIGAGAAGTSTSYYLRKFAEQAGIPLNITLYDRNDYIGGRSTTVDAYNDTAQPVELGASIFVPANRILVNATEEFNLSVEQLEQSAAQANLYGISMGTVSPKIGVWDGTQLVVELEEGDSWWDLAKLAWRYGFLSPYRMLTAVKEMIRKFVKIYDPPFFPWGSLTQVMYELGLSDMASMTGEAFVKEKGISEKFAREIVQALTRVNYAQNLRNIHAVEAVVSDATAGAMHVKGGNWQVFAKMAESSVDDTHLLSAVSSIERGKDGTFTLGVKSERANASIAMKETFDSVVIAAPHQYTDITFDPDPQFVPEKVPYVELHVTLFTSPHPLAPEAFNLPATQPVPFTILTTLPEGEIPAAGNTSQAGSPGFFSISTLREIDNPKTKETEYLYKIFSPTRVDDKYLARILGLPAPSRNNQPFGTYHSGGICELTKDQVSWIYRKVWQSYPYEFPRTTFEKLKLDERLWYTAGMEGFISTMETSALSGMNVARLIVDELIAERDGDGDVSSTTPNRAMGGSGAFLHGEQKPLKAGV